MATVYRTEPCPATRTPCRPTLPAGTGHNPDAVYSERPDDWEENLERLEKKHETARGLVPKPIVDVKEGRRDRHHRVRVGRFADYRDARPCCASADVETSYIRLRALPLEDTLTDFVSKHKRVYVVELNIEGQMRSLVRLHVPERAVDITVNCRTWTGCL